MKRYFVYMLTNSSKTLYTGMTNDLERRMYEHKQKTIPGFAKRYNLSKLVYFEDTTDVKQAIAREKEIKGWSRKKKNELIKSMNPKWDDLSLDWFQDRDSSSPKKPGSSE